MVNRYIVTLILHLAVKMAALFGNTAGRSQSKNLVEFRAGKMTMKGKMVHPDKRKGQVYVHQSDDSLMHFCWKDRTSGNVEEASKICIVTSPFSAFNFTSFE